jgi:serine/threonine protein kinase
MQVNIHFKIPGYRIDKVLGKGGMATVYLATQMSLGRPVSLKVLNDPETPQFFERFFNEGRCVARLSHSNLVTIYDIGQGDGFYYIAMEYLPGGDLKTQITQGMKPGQALKILARLASCLAYVHSRGVIHRDIKPSNILFRADGTPVLADFGIAKLIQTDNDLTVTGTVMGSPHYLSPEQAQGMRKLDGRSDIYSLGVVLFEMLAGHKPYTAESFAATLMAHIRKPIPRLPEELSRYQPLIDRMLAKKPEDRFQNGTELGKSIQLLRTRNRTLEDLSKTAAIEDRSFLNGRTTTVRQRLLIAISLLAGLPLGWSMLQQAIPLSSVQEKPVAAAAVAAPLAEAPINLEPLPVAGPNEQELELDETALWLEIAEARLQEDHLSLPPGDSAKDYFDKVLKIQPENEQASQGLRRIADRYALFARARLDHGQLPKARYFIDQGLAVQPGHGELETLLAQLETQQDSAPLLQSPVRKPQPRAVKHGKPGSIDLFDRLSPDHGR